jgi:hypothetical protein
MILNVMSRTRKPKTKSVYNDLTELHEFVTSFIGSNGVKEEKFEVSFMRFAENNRIFVDL